MAYDIEFEYDDQLDVDIEGLRGPRGYSDYELAVFEGFEGTLEEWLATLKGETGTSVANVYVDSNYILHVDLDDGTGFVSYRSIRGATGNGIADTVLNPDYTITVNYTDGESVTLGPIRGETGNGVESVRLNNDYTLTINYTDGESVNVGPIRGETGNGINSISLNPDYTLTITYTDGESVNVGPIRGATGNGIRSVALNPDYTLTIIYTDGENVRLGPIRGETGNGIRSAVLNQDYTLTITYTDGESVTLGPIRGATGNGIVNAVLNNDYTLTITYTDGESVNIGPIRGATGNGIASVVLNSDYTLTITYTDGESVTLGSIRGETGNGIASVTKTATEGLVDTYTITFTDGTSTTFTVTNGQDAEITNLDTTLTQEGMAADAKAVGDRLETKAEIDGFYEEMTVGDAEQLVSSQFVRDSAPYLFRTSGGSVDIGNREYVDAIVGGSLVWNQMASLDVDDWTLNRVNMTVTGTRITLSPTSNTSLKFISTRVKNGHKYLTAGVLKSASEGTSWSLALGIYHGGSAFTQRYQYLLSNEDTKFNCIFNSTLDNESIRFVMGTEATTANMIVLDKIQIFDLTAMFGSTIADYIYSLEQTTAGAGVAWFRKLFPNDYYEYNPGELISVSGLQSHDMVGFNAYDHSTGTAKVIGGNVYQITGAYTALTLDGEEVTPDSGGYFTPEHNGTLTVTGGNATTTCVHLKWSGTHDGEFAEYVKHSYPLDSSLELRGIPMLDSNNNLTFDGDRYLPDGTVERRYEVVHLGDGEWIKRTATGGNVVFVWGNFKGLRTTKLFGNNFTYDYSNEGAATLSDKCYTLVGTYVSGNLIIRDSAFDELSADDFKASLNGVYVVKRKTVTTETAEPYNEVQIVDDWGTEEFVSGTVVPVGHETRYPANLRDKLQHLPDLASDDGYYAIKQVGTQMLLEPFRIPKAPETDGTYVLKAMVTGGTPTYTWVDESEEEQTNEG